MPDAAPNSAPNSAPRSAHVPGVITRYARAWERGDLAGIVGCYGDDIVAHYGGQSEFAGTTVGRDNFVAILMETAGRSSRQLVSIDQIHDDGATGALFVTETIAVGGETVTLRRALRFRTDGKAITECWLFDQDQHLVDRAWARTANPTPSIG